jgi:hypothetical protein
VPNGRDPDRPYQLHHRRCQPARGVLSTGVRLPGDGDRAPRGYILCAIDRRRGCASPRGPAPTWRRDDRAPRVHRAWRAIPGRYRCDDLRFKHIAIVVADMESAYLRLRACQGWTAITRPAPQRLPANSGGVTASKFRDPEGHPLELLAFPPNNMPSRWREPRIETAYALGSIIPPSSFPARRQASHSTSSCWDFPSPGARSIAAGSRNSLMPSRVPSLR